MAILGIGTDIVKISRIKRVFKKFPKGFAERILHENELAILKHHSSPQSFIAKRFSAKEATAKALGTGIAHGVAFKEIEVSNDENGQPQLTLHGKTKEIAEQKGMTKGFISLTDEKNYAIAYVIIEKR